MEYGLRHKVFNLIKAMRVGLNPCCNGIWSQTYLVMSRTLASVLILVVMEYGLRQDYLVMSRTLGLNPCCNGIWSQTKHIDKYFRQGLNPCCNGIWSQTVIQ